MWIIIQQNIQVVRLQSAYVQFSRGCINTMPFAIMRWTHGTFGAWVGGGVGGGVRSFCVLGVISALSMYAARVC